MKRLHLFAVSREDSGVVVNLNDDPEARPRIRESKMVVYADDPAEAERLLWGWLPKTLFKFNLQYLSSEDLLDALERAETFAQLNPGDAIRILDDLLKADPDQRMRQTARAVEYALGREPEKAEEIILKDGGRVPRFFTSKQ